mmetsp:Transcript_5294/g.9161  ORF Transcript_5294/g.9161 Transcript_5294/m.9161 type:complete len:101 (+) Transcript_5294:127-429(+)
MCKRKAIVGGSFIGEPEEAHPEFIGVPFVLGVTPEPGYPFDWEPPFHDGVEDWPAGGPYSECSQGVWIREYDGTWRLGRALRGPSGDWKKDDMGGEGFAA